MENVFRNVFVGIIERTNLVTYCGAVTILSCFTNLTIWVGSWLCVYCSVISLARQNRNYLIPFSTHSFSQAIPLVMDANKSTNTAYQSPLHLPFELVHPIIHSLDFCPLKYTLKVQTLGTRNAHGSVDYLPLRQFNP
jgi:hypothetical protein